MQRAKEMGDRLVVILNNDNWFIQKRFHLYAWAERKAIIEALRYVDEVIITKHPPAPRTCQSAANWKN